MCKCHETPAEKKAKFFWGQKGPIPGLGLNLPKPGLKLPDFPKKEAKS